MNTQETTQTPTQHVNGVDHASMQPGGDAYEALIAQIAALKAQNAQLSARKQAAISLKVSDKGAVSAYGLGRFPVTLYGEQWTRLLAEADKIREFITANADKLATKDSPKESGTRVDMATGQKQ